ncbi:leucyl aminopeptidase [Paenibacillus radicis (ex Xue et al. 2023)]|uniref:Probable cytosol aminopeptidase n=1 Tax=Paenibacillus radicis (ex Xue et al. 2023) TaxID=2972489 RepID=A0ABT1YHE3_9BACL|nr:leucyl aminopeptidase [Paenibacillus radicis (ex Xue et al. 2023)]MCR8632602.1 leucyl aminopeptidase [Paenibacillus radicis (ex Xue et al. 2023)]
MERDVGDTAAEVLQRVNADALVLLLTPAELDDAESLKEWLPAPLAAEVAGMRERGQFAAELGQAEVLPTLGLLPCRSLVLSGLGRAAAGTVAWRDAGVYAARAALARGLERLAAPLPRTAAAGTAADAAAAPLGERVHALAEGLLLGGYRMPSYAVAAQPPVPALREVALIADQATLAALGGGSAAKALAQPLEAARAFAVATQYARDLTNLPGNVLVPDTLAQEAARVASQYGMACTVLDEAAIVEHGMGGLHAVGKGSANPPRMISIRYQGTDSWDNVVGLVGKGITFDTGGISLKKPDGMEEMISDMGGAAVLLGLLHAVGRLKPRINLVIVIPAAENMPSGAAFKPGDVIRMMSGHTVEVLNTDAEGRIVLGDGVTYAKQLGATRIVDVATLTGAVLVSFADVATGAVSNDEVLQQEIIQAAKQAGEKVWPFPNYPEYHDMLKSDVADIKNAASRDRWAGSITGGLFIGFFAGDTPWLHLDTGGTAWLWNDRGTEPKGGTGTMVRTLAHWLCTSQM